MMYPKYETNIGYCAVCFSEPGLGLNFYHTIRKIVKLEETIAKRNLLFQTLTKKKKKTFKIFIVVVVSLL